jgi:hypothetical protein
MKLLNLYWSKIIYNFISDFTTSLSREAAKSTPTNTEVVEETSRAEEITTPPEDINITAFQSAEKVNSCSTKNQLRSIQNLQRKGNIKLKYTK